jgi:hypothetical protein
MTSWVNPTRQVTNPDEHAGQHRGSDDYVREVRASREGPSASLTPRVGLT